MWKSVFGGEYLDCVVLFAKLVDSIKFSFACSDFAMVLLLRAASWARINITAF